MALAQGFWEDGVGEWKGVQKGEDSVRKGVQSGSAAKVSCGDCRKRRGAPPDWAVWARRREDVEKGRKRIQIISNTEERIKSEEKIKITINCRHETLSP